jgi:hypothetical protein
MYASTQDEIGAAIQAQFAWLRANPDDFGVLGGGEDLAYAFERLCLKLLLAMGYEFLPPNGQPGEDSLMRAPGGPADQRISVECIWTYVPAGVDSVHAVTLMMRHLHATEGLLFAGAGLEPEALQEAARRNIRVIDGEQLDRLIRAHAPELLVPDEQSAAEREIRAAAL